MSIAVMVLSANRAGGGATESGKAQPARPREVLAEAFTDYPPLFARRAATHDPVELARECRDGWLHRRGIAWGMMPDLKPTLRLSFDCRALPWPSIKQHSVDGPDNNMRALDGLAALHAMLGDEMKNDPAEPGIIGYLVSCTDPLTGIPYSPDSATRSCAIGHGEHTKNLILMYRYTGRPEYRAWAERALKTLRYYAAVTNRPGVGKVATYNQDGFVPGDPPATAAKDPTLGGWLHLALGWNLWAFSEWYQQTGDKDALELAAALGNRLCHSEDPDGNDGCFRPDGSFGGKAAASSASWHMHGHTHCLPGLVQLGGQLVQAGDQAEGLRFITQGQRTLDWLYDPAQNPDAGSLTGWLGEWLMVATGWPRQADCEGCTMGDIVQTACTLGSVSRVAPELSDLARYYDRAEQVFTSQLIEQTFRLRPRYLDVLRECIAKRTDSEPGIVVWHDQSRNGAGNTPQAKAAEVERRYREAVRTAERMVGQQLGACGFPDWVNKLPSDLDPRLPGIHMQGCCADATLRAAHAIWKETVTGNEREARVNLAFNRQSPLVDVVSCLPHRGELDLMVHGARRVLVRVPEWVPKDGVRTFIGQKPVPVMWQGGYVVFERVHRGQRLTVTYPLRLARIKETVGSLDGTEYTERWRGNTIVDISPPGKWIPLFQRPELEHEQLP
jgi:hypothetical protein